MAAPAFFDRPPRLQPPFPSREVSIPSPPDKAGRQNQSLLEMMLPLVTIVGYILIAMGGQGRNILLIIPMTLAMGVSIGLGVWRLIQSNREFKRLKAAYETRLDSHRRQILEAHQQQRDFYHYTYPDTETTLAISQQAPNANNRLGARLWERRTDDADFGAIRIGIGTRPSAYVCILQQGMENQEDPQLDEAIRLVEMSRYVDEVPLTLSLYRGKTAQDAPPFRHTLGIYAQTGMDKTDTHKRLYAFVQSMLVHFTTFHSYVDTHLYLIGTKAAHIYNEGNTWRWLNDLPHIGGVQDSHVCFEDETMFIPNPNRYEERLPYFWKNLRAELQARQLRLADRDWTGGNLPFLLVVVDRVQMASDSKLQNIETEAAISLIMQSGAELGAALIFLSEGAAGIPSTCEAIIELDTSDAQRVVYRYAEVGVNSPRLVGVADQFSHSLTEYAQHLKNMQIRVSAANTLASSIDLLQLFDRGNIEELKIADRWLDSRKSENATWPRVTIGVRRGGEKSELVFSADEAGVHGMVAGTTGSGKSELLLTLIAGLAANYDPSIVNFILVDFKGGAAFEEFRYLPHCVDVITNLDAANVDRMFASIKTELDRRSKLIADTGVKHIIEYREKNLHTTQEPMPSLFIIVDEFAEMVSLYPDSRAQLNSITRLGRAIGVSLILATQKPAGAITDQMRANMKFRICLRVQEAEDSREVIGRSDAALLPPGIPGRAYIQIGNQQPELIQVARTGGPYYQRANAIILPPVIWYGRERRRAESAPETLSAALVKHMHTLSVEPKYEVAEQYSPWPPSLPSYLALDTPLSPKAGIPIDPYYVDERDRQAMQSADPDAAPVLEPALLLWQRGFSEWTLRNWDHPQMLAPAVGIMDNPYAFDRKQILYRVDLRRGHLIAFGASGWGKTTFLRTFLLSLAVTHTPDQVQVYILDLGGSNFDIFSALPHVGDVITLLEGEKIARLIRRLNDEITRRKRVIAESNVPDIFAYNRKHPDKPISALCILLDNFAGLTENYEAVADALIPLLREGKNSGVYFIATADLPGAVGGKRLNQFQQILTLHLNDSGMYGDLVGRGSPPVGEIYGRGLVRVERAISRVPLEVQIAAPVGLTPDEMAKAYAQADPKNPLPAEDQTPLLDEEVAINALNLVGGERLKSVIDTLAGAWKKEKPAKIDTLQDHIQLVLPALDAPPAPKRQITAVIGIDDRTLKPSAFDLSTDSHFVVMGAPRSGRTTVLQSWVLWLAAHHPPEQVSMVLIDVRRRFFELSDSRGATGERRSLAELPHVLGVVSKADDLAALVKRLKYEYEVPSAADEVIHRPEIFLFIDNYDRLMDGQDKTLDALQKTLANLAATYYTDGLHVVVAGVPGILNGTDFVKRVWTNEYGLALGSDKVADEMRGKVPRHMRDQELPPGRGFLITSGKTQLTQIMTVIGRDSDTPASDVIAALDPLVKVYRDIPPYSWRYEVDIASGRLVEEAAAPPSSMSTTHQKFEYTPQTLSSLFTPRIVLLLYQQGQDQEFARLGLRIKEGEYLSNYSDETGVAEFIEDGRLILPQTLTSEQRTMLDKFITEHASDDKSNPEGGANA